MLFEFATATRIVFGVGSRAQLPGITRTYGQRPLVVTGRTVARAQTLLDALTAAQLTVTTFAVGHEPSIDDIVHGVAVARAARCDCVIGLGGGSAIDSAKAIAALLTNQEELLDYLEVIGAARPLKHPSAPCIAIPTTAGTGAEVTRNAVLSSPTHRLKVSLRSPHMLPRVALIDPELTRDLPPGLTASTGLDALTQLIEPYVSSRANPITDAICVEGLRCAARSLHRAVEHGEDLAAREGMSLASLFGGLALANSGLGAVHGLAGPIGGMFPAPHGAVCAALLPAVIETNIAALRARVPSSPALARFHEIARLLTGQPHGESADLIRWIRHLVSSLPIQKLSTYGITRSDFPALVSAAGNASSMKANPLPLTPAELTEILEQSL
ncbi:MAG: iron-containing alcohol dehydrogenase [Opitutus sp.]